MPRIPLLASLLSIGIIAAMAYSMAQNPAHTRGTIPHYLLTDREAVLISDPTLVAPSDVVRAQWAPDASAVVAISQKRSAGPGSAPPEVSVTAWYRSSGRSVEIWRRQTEFAKIDEIQWLSPDIAAAIVHWSEAPQAPTAATPLALRVEHEDLLWISATAGHVRQLPVTAGDTLLVSPTRHLAALVRPSDFTIHLLNEAGAEIKSMRAPFWIPPGPQDAGARREIADLSWAANGTDLIAQTFERANNIARPIAHYALTNLLTGVTTPAATAPARYVPKSEPGLLHVRRTAAGIREADTTQYVHPLWLESATKSERMRQLLCADASDGTLSPMNDGALYMNQGSVWVTTFRRTPKEPFLTNVRETLKSNGRQIGLALMMYAQDYDDALPAAGNAGTDTFNPYLKNDAIFDGFNYSFGGGDLSTVSDPTTTVIGTINGPGGHVNIYANGRIGWITP